MWLLERLKTKAVMVDVCERTSQMQEIRQHKYQPQGIDRSAYLDNTIQYTDNCSPTTGPTLACFIGRVYTETKNLSDEV